MTWVQRFFFVNRLHAPVSPFKQDNLLLYSHARLSSMEDGHSNSGSKDYLVSLMFSHYDLNNNGLLEAEELTKVRFLPSPSKL